MCVGEELRLVCATVKSCALCVRVCNYIAMSQGNLCTSIILVYDVLYWFM